MSGSTIGKSCNSRRFFEAQRLLETSFRRCKRHIDQSSCKSNTSEEPICQDHAEISVEKSGRDLENSPIIFKTIFRGEWSIIFGRGEHPTDLELMQRMEHIAANWQNEQYGVPCQVRIAARPWRTEEGGEISAQIISGSWDRCPELCTRDSDVYGSISRERRERHASLCAEIERPMRFAVEMALGRKSR
jgi:hypothetical protein